MFTIFMLTSNNLISQQLRQLLRLVHLGRLFDLDINRAAQMQRQAVLDCFNGTVAESDLDSIQLLKKMIDGSSVAYQSEALVYV